MCWYCDHWDELIKSGLTTEEVSTLMEDDNGQSASSGLNGVSSVKFDKGSNLLEKLKGPHRKSLLAMWRIQHPPIKREK